MILPLREGSLVKVLNALLMFKVLSKEWFQILENLQMHLDQTLVKLKVSQSGEHLLWFLLDAVNKIVYLKVCNDLDVARFKLFA
jgi:hypothetical protein